jgi:hypothetical protein
MQQRAGKRTRKKLPKFLIENIKFWKAARFACEIKMKRKLSTVNYKLSTVLQ